MHGVVHDIGSLTVSIPLSITLIIIFPFRDGGLKPAIHTAHSDGEINAAFGTNALSSFNSCPQHRQIPLLQTSSRSKKKRRKGRRPGAGANVYNMTVKFFTVPISQSKRPTWVSKRGYNKPCTVALEGDIHKKNGVVPRCMLQRLLPTPVILCRQIHDYRMDR